MPITFLSFHFDHLEKLWQKATVLKLTGCSLKVKILENYV